MNMKILISRIFFKLTGWTTKGGVPPEIRKCVLVAAPHTSNWDFFYCMCALYLMKVNVKFLAKKSLFNFPLGLVMYPTGGIPVDRTKNTNMVETMVKMFAERDDFVLMIPAEGTRGKVKEWKSGFYHTAVQSGVPIMMGYLDYKFKVAGIENVFYPSGDFEADLPKIKAYYKGIHAKHPELASV